MNQKQDTEKEHVSILGVRIKGQACEKTVVESVDITSLQKQQEERKQRLTEINAKLAELLKVDDELDALEREALELLIKRLRK